MGEAPVTANCEEATRSDRRMERAPAGILGVLAACLMLIAAPALAQDAAPVPEQPPAAEAGTDASADSTAADPAAEIAAPEPAEEAPTEEVAPEEAPAGDDQALSEEAVEETAPSEDAAPAQDAAPAGEAAGEEAAPAEELPEYLDIKRSPEAMPEPVRRTWQALRAAAQSGDIESLRPLIEAQEPPPAFAFDNVGDPIEYLKSLSGDAEGREILAIMLEILESGYLDVDRGTQNEMYLWPYFARYPLDRLTPQQIVELFTLITAGDWQDIQSYGAYIFFRLGIDPQGRWHFFLAGD